MKDGWKTSEFWVSLLSIILPLILRATGVEVSSQDMLGVGIVGGAYAGGRSYVKRGAPPTTPAA